LTVKNAIEFDFSFKDHKFDGGEKIRKLTKVEGILMNPQWADHAYDAASNSIKPVPGKTGLTIDEFSKIRIPEEVLRDGIIFIWVQKELIFSVIKVLESQNFEYVENLCHVMLDPKYFEATKRIGNTDATPAIYREPYRFLNKSHRTLLMLRRNIRRQDE
jgi:hypothetical protein